MSSVLHMRKLSVVEGGPLDRLQLRLGLMKVQRPLIVSRAVIFALIAWLPLLILSALQAVVLRNVNIPFLYDPSAHIRFLLSVPLLIVAEVVIGPRIVAATSQFITSGLIPEDRYQDFDAAIVDAIRLRDSTVAEAIILAITYLGAFLSIRFLSATVSTWHLLVSESGYRFTWAGYWYALVSLPIFQFLVYRWLWRTFIWCRFLRRVSKLDLQLIPTHPDQPGGLGLLGETHRLYGVFIFAYSATAAAVAAREVLFDIAQGVICSTAGKYGGGHAEKRARSSAVPPGSIWSPHWRSRRTEPLVRSWAARARDSSR